jgi:hypothetical protein
MELFKGDAVKFFGINKKIISGTTLSAEARNELTHIHIQRNINDWLVEAEDETYLHFEFQSDYDEEDLLRFMVTDAILYKQKRKPIRTIVVYTADIKNTKTTFDAGSIQYSVDAFYMSARDGDKIYADIKAKIDASEPLTKQDLMSIVFLPMMKSTADKVAQFEQAITLSKEVSDVDSQNQIHAMLHLLADKFIKDKDTLRKLKEMLSMGAIAEMIKDDAVKEDRREIAKRLLKRGLTVSVVIEDTGLDEETVLDVKAELGIL